MSSLGLHLLIQIIPVGSSQYTVVSGDSLAGIAAAHGISLSQLLAANQQITNPDLIQAGQTITIPAAGTCCLSLAGTRAVDIQI